MPSSSRSSRTSASRGSSRGLILPPGSSHVPARCAPALRCVRSTLPPSNNTPATTTTRVFARKGFYATRVSEVAKAAGVADGTIYLYFKSKDDLLVSLFEDRIMLLLETLERELQRRPSAQERLRCVIEMQLGLLEGE